MYEKIFYVGVILFVTGLIVTVILFMRNNIAKIIGDLTGFHAKRIMKNLQREKEDRQAGILSEVLTVTDILPVKEECSVANGEAVPKIEDLFEIEEDITVLGGEFVSQMPTAVLSGLARR